MSFYCCFSITSGFYLYTNKVNICWLAIIHKMRKTPLRTNAKQKYTQDYQKRTLCAWIIRVNTLNRRCHIYTIVYSTYWTSLNRNVEQLSVGIRNIVMVLYKQSGNRTVVISLFYNCVARTIHFYIRQKSKTAKIAMDTNSHFAKGKNKQFLSNFFSHLKLLSEQIFWFNQKLSKYRNYFYNIN